MTTPVPAALAPRFLSFEGTKFDVTHEQELLKLLDEIEGEGKRLRTSAPDQLPKLVGNSLVPALLAILRGFVCKIDSLNYTVHELAEQVEGDSEDTQFLPEHQALFLDIFTKTAAMLKGALATPGMDVHVETEMRSLLDQVATAAAIVADPERLLEEVDDEDDEEEGDDEEDEDDGPRPAAKA